MSLSCSFDEARDLVLGSQVGLCVVAVIVLAVALRVILTVLRGLRYLTYSSKSMRRYGGWAVVTGATDGIGLGYAREFARQGVNVLLVSRTEAKLAEKQSELEKEFGPKGVKFDHVAADLTDDKSVALVTDKLKEIEVGILVNNAGMSYEHADYLHLISDELVAKLIQINIVSLTRLTKAVLPGMESRKKGLIINVGSAAGTMTIGDPLYAVYSGTKAYVDAFSRSLYLEYKGKNIHVECSVPYFVASNMSRIRKPTLMAPSANAFARAAVRRSGNWASVVPYTMHAIQDWVSRAIPEWALTWYVWSHHLDIRRRAYKKKEAAAKTK